MKQFQFKKYCSPAQLYLVLAAIGLILGFFQNFKVITLIVHSAFVILFGFILNLLCKKGYSSISWVIVALPFVFFLCSYFLALDASDKKDEEFVEGMTGSGDAKTASAPTNEVNCAAVCDEDPMSKECEDCSKKEGFQEGMEDFCKQFPDDPVCSM